MLTCKPTLIFTISVQFSVVWIDENLFFILMLMDIGLFSSVGQFQRKASVDVFVYVFWMVGFGFSFFLGAQSEWDC